MALNVHRLCYLFMRILELTQLKVNKPMILEIDNKSMVDLSNNWSAGGRFHHIDVKHHFLCVS